MPLNIVGSACGACQGEDPWQLSVRAAEDIDLPGRDRKLGRASCSSLTITKYLIKIRYNKLYSFSSDHPDLLQGVMNANCVLLLTSLVY